MSVVSKEFSPVSSFQYARRRGLWLRAAIIGAIVAFVAVLAWFSFPYVARSWAILERSRESSGLPLVFLLKTLIPVFALLLGLQGVAQAARAWLVLAGGTPAEPGR